MSSSRVVYSSETGRLCPDCGDPVAGCRCAAIRKEARPAGDGIVRVRRETSGRGGKVVTTVAGVPGDAEELARVGKELKARCGVGGTVRDWVIEIQGDQVDKVIAALTARGLRVRRAGG